MIVNIQWSKFVKSITWITLLAIIGSSILLAFNGSFESTFFSLLFIFVFLVLLYFAAIAPLSITIDEKQLIVNRPIKNLRFNLSHIIAIENFDRYEFQGIKLVGSDGYCGFTGLFHSSKIGKYISCVGDYSQAFLIQTENKKYYVLSCEDREKVVNIIRSKIEQR